MFRAMSAASISKVPEPHMKNKYLDLIEQTFEFPNEEFEVVDNNLEWFGIPLMDIIKQYGTPLRIAYLPKIASNIQKARRMAD